MSTRKEKDTLGPVEVPGDAYYGAQTARAIANFPISGLLPHPALVWGTLVIKKCAAKANMATGRLEHNIGAAIVQAADEALAGKFAGQFVVDPFQAGAGTSHNMNVNEVLANRANELLGGALGTYDRVNPNDHVNMAQSTNDVFPTAMRLSALHMISLLLREVAALRDALRTKGEEFDGILKSGRTHLQDAVPVRLGQEFEAYAAAIGKNLTGIERCLSPLCELGLGGTAVGTGMNAESRYIQLVTEEIGRETSLPVYRAANLIETTQNMDPFVTLSSSLKGLAVNLVRIANDLRLLSSGPRTGLNEISLPALQPGSSIMPGKVNPVMAEVTDMVAFQVIGADTAITLAAQAGQLELNVMMPILAHNLFEAMQVTIGAVQAFTMRGVQGVTANREKATGWLAKNAIVVTALNPVIGYAQGAALVKEALTTTSPDLSLMSSVGFRPAMPDPVAIESGRLSFDWQASLGKKKGPAKHPGRRGRSART